MSFFSILETILIGPLKLVFEIIFSIANRLIGHPGLAIIVLSLVMNILVLPLYKRADAMQEEARDIEAKLSKGIAHIKKTFSGDERMMIMQTYYRQNNYSPVSTLNGSVSLLLEIPFFMAAYQFLSHLEILDGVALGPITNLGAPDGLIVIGGLAINVLPILMTLINIVSGAIYLKGFPLKTKIQLYAMAVFFLIFLYNSPACLVFYWTLNNVFSLVKNIFYKLKNPRKVLSILTALCGVLSIVFGLFVYETNSWRRKVFFAGVGVILLIPLVLPLLKKGIKSDKEKVFVPKSMNFIVGAVFLIVLVGLLIPSAYIAASPQEYVDLSYFYHPNWYVASALCMAVGTFMVWFGVFYWLANDTGKVIFEKLIWIMGAMMLVNYMFFGTELGIITSTLTYESGLVFSAKEQLINVAVIAAVALIVLLSSMRWAKKASMVFLVASVALTAMSAVNVHITNTSISELLSYQSEEEVTPYFELSQDGQNVIVMMLDRGMGEYIPYLFNEKPELAKQFEGFTYYSNVISFGAFTNFGAPPLYGGYEYTPVEMNRREEESLADKNNEALKVMPVLFYKNGYDITVCDPTYAGYQWSPDLTIYDDYPEMNTFITKGNFSPVEQNKAVVANNMRNFFCFAIMKTMPIFVQPVIYNFGDYNQATSLTEEVQYSSQYVENVSKATGIGAAFMDSYNVLCNLPNMTHVVDSGNTFLMMCNEATHDRILLQVPEYEPAHDVDNTEYDAMHMDRFTLNGRTLTMETELQMMHYQSNMAVMLKIGEWLDYLRENDVYDNTRIIIVSDHGQHLQHLEELVHGDGSVSAMDVESYYPLLMVKDFDSDELVTSDEFMTNADVPTMAMEGLIDNPVNPFTGKAINSDEKTAHEQFIIMSWDWDVEKNNGNTFLPSRWASVKDNLWVKENWTFYEGEHVLSEYAAP